MKHSSETKATVRFLWTFGTALLASLLVAGMAGAHHDRLSTPPPRLSLLCRNCGTAGS